MCFSFLPWRVSKADIETAEAEDLEGTKRADEFVFALRDNLPAGTLTKIVASEEFDIGGGLERAFFDRLQQRMEIAEWGG